MMEVQNDQQKRLNYYGDRTNLETMHRVQLYTLICASFVAYLVMILCGTLGSPGQITDISMSCGPHNDCSLDETLAYQMQVCQSNQDQELHSDDVNFLINFYLPSDYNKISPDDIAVQVKLGNEPDTDFKLTMNTTMAVYDSDDPQLLHFCQVSWADIINNHDMLSKKYTVSHYKKNLITDLSCNQTIQYGSSNETYTQCKPIEPIARLQDDLQYRMIKIAFHRQTQDNTVNVVNKQIYTGLNLKARNPHLEKYKCILQVFFLIVNVINLTIFVHKIKQVPWEEIGQVQYLTTICLGLLLLYNLPYKFVFHSHFWHMYIDSAFTSIMFTFVILLVLVLFHGIAAPRNISAEKFYAPKVIPCLIVSVALFFYQLQDDSVVISEFDYSSNANEIRIQNNQNELLAQKCLTAAMSIYGITCIYYLYYNFMEEANINNEKARFYNSGIRAVLIVSLCTVGLLVVPVKSNTLQFMNENGLLNIYLIMLTFLVTPSSQSDLDVFNASQTQISEKATDVSLELSDLSSDEKPPITDLKQFQSLQNQPIYLESGEEDHQNPETVIRRTTQRRSDDSPVGTQRRPMTPSVSNNVEIITDQDDL